MAAFLPMASSGMPGGVRPATEATPLAADGSQHGTAGTFDDDRTDLLGLSSEEAARRLAEDGPNILDPPQKESFLGILVTQMKNIIFLLTTCAALLCMFIGDEVKAYVLLGIVGFVCLANSIGEYSAQNAAEALAKMASPKALVLRAGREELVPAKDLVIGDMVKVQMGDIVPADILLLESIDLQVNEAALTGEPCEQKKSVQGKKSEKTTFPPNMIFAATNVLSGKCMGEVVATGMLTQVGLIAKKLKHKDETLQLNPLQKSINLLGTCIGMACLMVVVIATLTSYMSKYQNPMSPCADDDDQCLLVTSVVRGLILAVSLIPHGLPFIVMVMLRVGSLEMAKRNAVVTRQSTVDYLGATTVICTDKTGTLTEGKMTAEALIGLCREGTEGSSMESSLAFYPLRGTNPNGGLFRAMDLTVEQRSRMDDDFGPQEKRQDFSEPGMLDLADPKSACQPKAAHDALLARAHLVCAFLNCHETSLVHDPATGRWAVNGNMTEGALKIAAAKGGYMDGEGIGPELLQVRHRRDDSMEVPFSSKRKMMATVHELPTNRQLETLHFPKDATHAAVVKGAPDLLLPKVSALACLGEVEGTSMLVVPDEPVLSDEERAHLRRWNDDLSARALRSLLVAVRPLDLQQVEALRAASVDDRLAALVDGPGLCFLSLWGICDPPRVMVPRSVDECHQAGIRVVMITGDQRPTAVAVARQVHILGDDDDPGTRALSCTELQQGPSRSLSWRVLTRLSSFVRRHSGQQKEWSPLEQIDQSRRDLAVDDAGKEKREHEFNYRSSQDIARMTSLVSVWSRAQPTDKVTIVGSLGEQGHITAMTGDGVNDAPALKHAMVGVSMGISGTEVAKGASELILMDDDFSTIVAAIREGRKIYANVQKYVVFNLSIKAGECTCLLMAIASGVPMPIRGLQLLLNLVCTHIVPTMALAWEEAEPYLMRVPPRKTKFDLVVPPVMWLFRWLPFVMYMPAIVLSCLLLGVWMHTGFVYGNSIIGSSRVGLLDQGLVACEYAGMLNLDGRFMDDAMPFHCHCKTHPSGLPWTDAVSVEQWGRVGVPAAELEASLDRWTGQLGRLFDKDQTPWMEGIGRLLEPCTDRRGVERWCWKEKGLSAEERPVLPQAYHCAAYGARLGQAMAYATIHLGEILSLLTFRMDGFFLPRTLSNPVFTGLLLFNLCALVTFLYAPPVTGILELAPLSAPRLAFVACFALCLVALNEATKVAYRGQVAQRNALLEKEALLRSRGSVRRPDSAA